MSNQNTEPEKSAATWTGRKFLFAIIAFFGVVFTVNFIMAYLAVDTFSGVVEDKPYEFGRQYNVEIERSRVSGQSGWSAKITVSRDTFLTQITNSDFAVDKPENVTLHLTRPATKEGEQWLTLRQVQRGIYAQDGLDLANGRWQYRLEAWRGEERLFRQDGELWIEPIGEAP